ncbi:bax Inhibitor-1 [Lycorma delicatula]|uniref:bax Inhibitor-1 n=1 Tax=Lycorma delicatula TaxID=130591 RepID=UPI003F50FC82
MPITITSFLQSFNAQLEEPVRQHLKNVYACLTLSSLAAAVGAYIHMYTEILQAGLLTVFAASGLLLALMATPDSDKNRRIRIGLLLGFAFFSGMGMGPLLQLAIMINPSIIVTALIGTSLIFVSFSMAALTAKRGKWLYLGGTLMTALTGLLIVSFANIFLGSHLIFMAYLYIGLLVMCGFVLYDTQLIIEKRRNGDRDFVTHSVDLFIDLVGIFRRILIILSEKEEKKRHRKNED